MITVNLSAKRDKTLNSCWNNML